MLALVTAIYEDRRRCREFFAWTTELKKFPKSIQLIEQHLVDGALVSEAEAERRGLPDAWFHDGDAILEFDWRTAFPASRELGVKLQKHWISDAYGVLDVQ